MHDKLLIPGESSPETVLCSVCGKTFDELDHNEDFYLDYHIGYGSRYDLNRLRLHMCIDCFDNLLDFILPQCKINPLSEYYFQGEYDVFSGELDDEE